MQVIKLALNYHWDQDPRAAWADAPVFGVAAMPVKARPVPILEGWEVDAGGRYWYSSGKEKNTSGDGILTSQLTYSNLTGHSGELFARVDTPSRVFVKGYVGAGAITSGKSTDEDWGKATFAKSGFMVSNRTTSGWLNYAAADVGYNVLRDRDYKVGPFVGYSYFRQNINAFGCSFSVPAGQTCLVQIINRSPRIKPSSRRTKPGNHSASASRLSPRYGIVGGSTAMSPTCRMPSTADSTAICCGCRSLSTRRTAPAAACKPSSS